MVMKDGTTPVKKRTRAPKAQRLEKQANVRVPRAIRALRAVADLQRFQPTDEQRRAIVTVLQSALSDVDAAFAAPVVTIADDFKLPVAA